MSVLSGLFDLDQRALRAIRMGGDPRPLLDELAAIPEGVLYSALKDVKDRRAFWINLYNAFALLALDRKPDLQSAFARIRHFRDRAFVLAGHRMSLDDIEHGMLRHSQFWWSMGLLQDPFPDSFERRMRVPLDPRIHFALNCGAAACPPIAFYDGPNLEDQLEMATASFLEQDAVYDQAAATVQVSRLMLWYRRDLGSRSGTIALLKRHGIVPEGAEPGIIYKAYDWSVIGKDAPGPGSPPRHSII